MKCYTIAQSEHIYELIRIVNEALRDGMLLAGGMTRSDGIFYQTLYKTGVPV